ncbi:MAG: MobA/MobL family protein [Hyphomicrobiaceae bacterium]
MAIYSCNLKSIGRTTHDAGTAGAHIRYISRPEAQPEILSHHMPGEAVQARTWMDSQERLMRKNARVLDKLRIALPRELTEAQREGLVAGFMGELTGGRIGWYAAIHQRGKDELNPHVHIAIHDRDIQTGKRVLRLSDSARDRVKAGLPGPKAVEWVRERWEDACNRALKTAGLEARVSRRTLEAQGIDRAPTIHEGPRAQHIDDNVGRPKSRERINGCGRVIDYPSIDKGRTRREFNAHIIDLNLQKASRSKNPATAIWALFEQRQAGLDAALEKRLAGDRRQRTAEARNTSQVYLARIHRQRAEARLKRRAAETAVRERFAPIREELRERQQQERKLLRNKQSRLYMRIIAMLDFTGITRRRQEAARKELAKAHTAARKDLSVRYHAEKAQADRAVKDRYRNQIEAERGKRVQHVAQLKERHAQLDRFADIERQQREIDREQMRTITDQKLEEFKKEQGEKSTGKTSGDFANAIVKAAKQEADRGGKNKGKDRGLER